MPTSRSLRTVLFCASSALVFPAMTGCDTLTKSTWLAGPISTVPGGRSALETGKKVYAVQQKLKALNFTIRSDPAGGQFAFIATKEVKTVPISLNVDLAQSPMTRAVSVAGIAVPLQGGGTVSFDAPLRAALLGKGVPAAALVDIEANLNAAIEAINTLGA
jgi:hypothetical protein